MVVEENISRFLEMRQFGITLTTAILCIASFLWALIPISDKIIDKIMKYKQYDRPNTEEYEVMKKVEPNVRN